jgi:hypothetical protein
MNGAYGYWIGCLDVVRQSGTEGDLIVYERQALLLWQSLWI